MLGKSRIRTTNCLWLPTPFTRDKTLEGKDEKLEDAENELGVVEKGEDGDPDQQPAVDQ